MISKTDSTLLLYSTGHIRVKVYLRKGSRQGFRASSPSGPRPCGVRFRCIHPLDLMPRPHGIVMRRTFVVRHIVGNEVHVASLLDPQRSALALVESDRLNYQVAVRDPAARSNLFFAPPVEQITGPRCTLETRLNLRGFSLDEHLGLLIARVAHNREIDPQSSIQISWSLFGRH